MKSLRRICVSFGLVLTVLFGAAAPVWAQASTGGLRGVVKDESGAVLVGVTVEAESPARIGGAAVEVSDAEGTYRFENLRSASTPSASRFRAFRHSSAKASAL